MIVTVIIVVVIAAVAGISVFMLYKKMQSKKRDELFSQVDISKFELDEDDIIAEGKEAGAHQWTEIKTKTVIKTEEGFEFTGTPGVSITGLEAYRENEIGKLLSQAAEYELKEDDLRKLQGIIAQSKILDRDRDPHSSKRQEASFSLFSVLEKLARENGLMESIDHMKPGSMDLDSMRQEKWVEVKLSQINYKDMVSYLYHLQSYANNIYIKRLTARKNGEYIDLVFQPAVIVNK